MSDAVLALDQGTTGTTALVIARDGEILGRGYTELPQHYPRPGWVEHDGEEIWATTMTSAREALREAGMRSREVVALGLTNQRETTLIWDKATGRPVHRAIVWQSRQTAEICRDLERAGRSELVRERTGLVIDAYFSATKARWILDREPDLQRRAERGELLFGTVDSWLVWRLSGGQVHVTEPTNASRTMLFDIHRRAWDDELLEALHLPREMLPEVAPSSARTFAETSGVDGLVDGLPIAGIAGDQQAALFGQGCWSAGQAKNTYGTGCFLVMNTGERAVTSVDGLLTSLACDASGRPVYCLEGSIFSAGSAVQWLRDELRMLHRAEESETLARSIDDTGGVYLVPAFSGLGSPYWDMDARGAIVGLTRGTGRAELVRAALESIAYQTCDVLQVMRRDAGVPVNELRVDGGASANNFLMQFQADLAQVPVDRPMLVESTALGAAFLAGLTVEFWPDHDAVAAVRHSDRRFTPSMDAERRANLYAGWKRAVSRILTG